MKKAFLIPFIIILCLCSYSLINRKDHTEPIKQEPSATSPDKGTAPEAEPEYITLAAVGDNLIHNTIFKSAKTENGYDFTPIYEHVRGLIDACDLRFVNQEAPLATDIYTASGYPNFNTPQEAGRDLVKTGFNVINEANNHAMDKGDKAVLSTVEFWKSQNNVIMTGMYDSEEDRNTPRIFEKNGIRVGIISYTFGTNQIPVPKDEPFLISVIDKDKIRRDIEALDGKCDLIVASMHWGVEYNLSVTDEQRELAGYLAGLGVDLIIGHHPHVVEPAEWVEAENGNRAFCVYSLGNFVSSQQKRVTMLGGMLLVKIEKDPDG
ncbi:MAG: CapA family protein, partial [Bacillota bacterium]|nr:CapA family protein [Bacillota bacterium]